MENWHYDEGRTVCVCIGGVSNTVREQNKKKIKDDAYNNFVYLNHENKQVRYSF